MSWTVHRQCASCGRKFSFQAPPINKELCELCVLPIKPLPPRFGPSFVAAFEAEVVAVEKDIAAELERQTCRGWAESDLEHAHHLAIERGEQ